MNGLRPVAAALGIILVVCGLFFAAQGAGIVRWPASSFMVSNSGWITNGLLIAAAGALAFIWSRRRPA